MNLGILKSILVRISNMIYDYVKKVNVFFDTTSMLVLYTVLRSNNKFLHNRTIENMYVFILNYQFTFIILLKKMIRDTVSDLLTKIIYNLISCSFILQFKINLNIPTLFTCLKICFIVVIKYLY